MSKTELLTHRVRYSLACMYLRDIANALDFGRCGGSVEQWTASIRRIAGEIAETMPEQSSELVTALDGGRDGAQRAAREAIGG